MLLLRFKQLDQKDLRFRLLVFGCALLINVFLNLPQLIDLQTGESEVTATADNRLICSQASVFSQKPPAHLAFAFGFGMGFLSSNSSSIDAISLTRNSDFSFSKESSTYLTRASQVHIPFNHGSPLKTRGPPFSKNSLI